MCVLHSTSMKILRTCQISSSIINLTKVFYLLVPDEHKLQTLTTKTRWTHTLLTALCRKWCPWFSCGVTECEAGWMCGLARGQTGAETWEETDGVGGFGGPAVLLGRAVVQSVVGVGQRGPACLANVQRADGLIPQSHRTGRGTERSGRKGRGGASGTSHLSHAGHATTNKHPPEPQTHRQKWKIKMMRKRGSKNKKERRNRKKENTGTKQRKSFLGILFGFSFNNRRRESGLKWWNTAVIVEPVWLWYSSIHP